MINDIGTFKAVLAPSLQPSPTAKEGSRTGESPRGGSPLAAPQQPGAAAKAEPLEDVVSDLNRLVQNLQRELQFSVDNKSGDTVIKIVDRETDEVIRQIPSAEIVALRRRLEDANGVIFQDSA